jgi:hypothetical protein
MPDFRFDESKGFEENCEAFLQAVKEGDPEMADILRNNWKSLIAIVREGERDAKARGDFNSNVAAALDAIANAAAPKDGA